MHVQVEVPADPERVGRLVREVYAPSFRRYRALGVLALVAGAGFLALSWRGSAGRTWLFPLVTLLVTGVLMLTLPTLLVRRSRKASSKLAGGAWTYVLSEGGLAAASASSRQELAWEVFERARETEDYLLLYLSKMQVVGIPLDRLTAGDRAEVRALLQSRGLLPAAATHP